ncbi:MAG: WG repeat-containing protein [Lewinellaceae bacterium]|nr:WG repeat-containing protein [Lewinellaceae bacterium]
MTIPASFDTVTPFRDGLALATIDDKWQYIDRFGGVLWRES